MLGDSIQEKLLLHKNLLEKVWFVLMFQGCRSQLGGIFQAGIWEKLDRFESGQEKICFNFKRAVVK